MHARKWISSSTKALEQIPSEDRAGSVEILEKHLLEIKALDVQWLPLNDQFTFTMSNNKEKVTLPKGCFLVG